ncbi:MAG TPA: ATP-binding protein [Gemmatimonadaceae bacterium]
MPPAPPHAKTVVFPSLLIVDEIGYRPITRTGAMFFFQLMSRRDEHAVTVLTSSKGFEEGARSSAMTSWPQP